MRELNWQERPNKKARCAERKARCRGERSSTTPTGDAASGQLQNCADGTTATKRRQSTADITSPKKMKKAYDPGYSSISSNIVSSEPLMAVPAATLENDASEQYEAAVPNGSCRPRHVTPPQRCPNTLFRAPAVSALHRSRLSPYTKLETAQQRRESRERERQIRRLQQIERDVHPQQGGMDRFQGETANPGNEPAERSVPTQSVTIGARPKERLEGSNRKESMDPNDAELHGFTENALEAEGSEPKKDNEKHSSKSAALRLNVQEPETKKRSVTLPLEGPAREGRQESRDSEKDLFRNELATQLLVSEYADSQTMVRNLRQINEQYAEKIATLSVQISLFDNRHQEDKLRTETHCAEVKQLREEYAKKLAGMCERIEAFEKRHREDQATITEHQQQLAALSTQLTQTTENRRLELDQFERFQLDSQREHASQQQTLTSCHTRLERLHSATSRQLECLECSICLGLFSRPVTLNCGHTFCEVCIETNRHSAILPDSCPLCRQFIRTSVRSAVVGQLAEITRELEHCHV